MIELTIADGVAEVTLNAPQKLNALTVEALGELGAAYASAAEAGVRALVLRGEGRAFCAGRDIVGVDATSDDPEGFLKKVCQPLFEQMAAFPAPTFAAVQGACLGLGLGLAIASDIVYVGESAKIGSPFANIGGALDSGGHWLFAERLGPHRAMDLIVTGEFLSGREAVDAGLFSRCLPDAELLEFTRGKARKATEAAALSFVESKRIIAAIRDKRLGLWDAVALENKAQGDLAKTHDYVEGMTAFKEKRPPRFEGR